MKHLLAAIILIGSVLIFNCCNKDQRTYDASGLFEAEEIIISAEVQGILKEFDLEEGQQLRAGQMIGHIDSVPLHLKRKQLRTQIAAILHKKPNIPVQLSALSEQLKTAENEKIRISNLVSGDGAIPKQLDDIRAEIAVLKGQIKAQKSSLSILIKGLDQDVIPLQVQIEQVEDQLSKCVLLSPISGTVLIKYAQAHELVTIGMPLYKISDLSHVVLRAYITGNQLCQIQLNQRVKVWTDDGKGSYNETEGAIFWISDSAEFTPKTIQTKDERAMRVYAIKVKVKNAGLYKIGMYAEIKL